MDFPSACATSAPRGLPRAAGSTTQRAALRAIRFRKKLGSARPHGQRLLHARPVRPLRASHSRMTAPACVVRPSQALLWYYARPSVLETVISATSTLEGSPPYQCIGLGAYSAPSATISRDTLEGGTTGCADLLLPQGSPGAPAQDPNTLEGAGWEISVNLGATTNSVFNNSALCPDGGNTCKRPFVYVSPFTTAATTFGTYDFATCGTLLKTRSTCLVTPHVARAVDSLRVSYNNFNFPTYDACVANLRVACTDGAPLQVLGPTVQGSTILQPMPYSRKGYQAGFNGTYRLKQCSAVTGGNGAGLSFSWIDNAFLATKLADGQDAYAYPPPPPRCARVQCVGMFRAAACAASAAYMI
jgi:hypothetical protein